MSRKSALALISYVLACIGFTIVTAPAEAQASRCSALFYGEAKAPLYSSSRDAIYTAAELETLRLHFNKTRVLNETLEGIREEAVWVNTVHLGFRTKARELYKPGLLKEFSHDRLDPEIEPLLTKLLQKTIEVSRQNPRLRHHLRRHNQNFVVELYGIRYLLPPGKPLKGLPLHRDSGHVQSLIVLSRPEGLEGGQTVVAWPQEPYPEIRRSYVEPHHIMETTITTEVPSNHILVFDGRNALHGTSDFRWKPDAATNPIPASVPFEVRDVIGLALYPMP